MRYIIAVILSAALIWALPKADTPVNKSTIARVKTHTVQAVAPEKATEVQSSAPMDQKAIAEPAKEVTQVTSPPVPSTHEELMNQAGISPEDYGAADYITTHESSWRSFATEPHTGAYGLCQSLPAVKMASAGSDWQTNPVTQLKWCNSYALTRYGGWHGAYAHWVAYRWW